MAFKRMADRATMRSKDERKVAMLPPQAPRDQPLYASERIVGTEFVATAHGGADAGTEMLRVFEEYVRAEYAKDVAELREVHGQDAPLDLLARSEQQRRFDALQAIHRDAAAATGLGCIHHQSAGFALYEPATPRRPSAEVARLLGPIASVDGREVSAHGRSFELEPGCHVVVTRKQMFDFRRPDLVDEQFLPATFAFRMKPAHAYVVEAPERIGGETGVAVLQAHEEAPDGTKTPLGPTFNTQMIDGCKAWSPG